MNHNVALNALVHFVSLVAVWWPGSWLRKSRERGRLLLAFGKSRPRKLAGSKHRVTALGRGEQHPGPVAAPHETAPPVRGSHTFSPTAGIGKLEKTMHCASSLGMQFFNNRVTPNAPSFVVSPGDDYLSATLPRRSFCHTGTALYFSSPIHPICRFARTENNCGKAVTPRNGILGILGQLLATWVSPASHVR